MQPLPSIHAHLQPVQPHTPQNAAYAYTVAGLLLTADAPLRLLQSFTQSLGAVNGRNNEPSTSQEAVRSTESNVRHASGSFGGMLRPVSVVRSGSVYSVEIEGIGRFSADCLSGAIRPLEVYEAVEPALLEEAVLGTPLLLLLGARQRWLLHCSSVRLGRQLIAFVGPSGWGKSTLGAYLGERRGWQRVGDDMLPLSADDEGVWAWPRFPQFKLKAEDQPGSRQPERLRLSAIYILASPQPAIKQVEISPLATATATAAVIGQTAGAKLFDATLLAQHLEFCAELALRIPIKQLSYPRRLDALPAVAKALEADVAPIAATDPCWHN